MAPSDRIKYLLQIQHMCSIPQKYKDSLDCARQLYLEGGIRNIYKGTVATMLRDVPASGMSYVLHDLRCGNKNTVDESGGRKSIATIIAGGLAGIANWAVAMPSDVLKSRLQTAPKETYPNGIKDVFKELMVREGPTALYKRVTSVMIRAFPANAT